MSIKKPDAERGGSDTSEKEGDLRGAGEPDGGGFGDDLQAQGTEVLGDSPDDVLVLLPDGTDIPIVETEAVDEPSELDATHTEIVDGTSTVPLEDVPLKDTNPLVGDSPFAGSSETPAPTENLEELASDMDDEFLAPEGQEAAAPAARASRRPPIDRGSERAVPQFYPSGEQSGERRRPRRRAPLAVAALLALAVTGYLTFPQWKPYVESYLPGVLSSSGRTPVSATPPASTGHVPVASKTAPPGPTDGGGDTKTVDMVRASKEAFREKFLLSIELGYVGEVADE